MQSMSPLTAGHSVITTFSNMVKNEGIMRFVHLFIVLNYNLIDDKNLCELYVVKQVTGVFNCNTNNKNCLSEFCCFSF